MSENEIAREVARLVHAQRWLALATLDERGAPAISYVPFAPAHGAFGIVGSRLAAHTNHLLANRAASVLLVEDAPEQSDAYARRRCSIIVAARINPAGSEQAGAIWSALEQRQGSTAGILHTLPDFEAISLEPQSARLVLGFASAHDVAAATIAEALR